MRQRFYKGRFVFIPLAVAAFLSLISFVVMSLWNYLLPGILHVGFITFWQAMGIFVLCKILFGFGRGGHRMGGGQWGRHKWDERFKNMTPEEKELFKAKIGDKMHGCRGWDNRSKWDSFRTETSKAAE